MRFLKVLVMILGFTLISCKTQGDVSISKVDKVKASIKFNKELLLKRLGQGKNEDLQLSLDFVESIEMGRCEPPKNANVIDDTFLILYSFSYKENPETVNKATRVLECISSLSINKEYHYVSLISTMIPIDGDITAFKLIYKNLFDYYIPAETQKLGLLDYAMLECNSEVLSYLKQQNYPGNANNLFSSLEYAYFKKLTNALCHEYENN